MEEATTVTLAGGKRERAKAANRHAILEAARTVFARIGYDSTTVRDIIRETELAAGTFYNYFKSKEEVFEALSTESTRRFRPLLREVRSQATDFASFIEGAYRAFFQFLVDEHWDAISGGTPRLMVLGVRYDTPEMQAIFEEIRADIENMMPDDHAATVDTEYLTAAAVGIARELGDHMLKRRPVDVEIATRFATSLLLAGLQGVPEKPDQA